MEHAFGLDIPRTLQEACHPARTALIVYDMQVGVVGQIADGAQVTRRVVDLVAAARTGGYRVIYLRHMFPPPALSGVAALRTAMAWQRVDSVTEVRPFLTRDAPASNWSPSSTRARTSWSWTRSPCPRSKARRSTSSCATAASTRSSSPE